MAPQAAPAAAEENLEVSLSLLSFILAEGIFLATSKAKNKLATFFCSYNSFPKRDV